MNDEYRHAADIGAERNVSLRFATFWSGPRMSAVEQACLISFRHAGLDVSVYGFEQVEGLPANIVWKDARQVVHERDRSQFLYRGQPNTQHFTDYFRFILFRETGEAWIDTDMVLLRPLIGKNWHTLLAKENESSICNAIMRIDPADAILPELIKRVERLKGKDLVWGATGPRLLNHVVGRRAMLERACPSHEFFPIHYDRFWTPLLPEFADECASLCADAFTLHLWNNVLTQLGYWKDMAPPVGSFLWKIWKEQDLLPLFSSTYPVEVMRQMIRNYRLRKSGADIGIVQSSRQLLPSLGRTLGPRLRALQQLRP